MKLISTERQNENYVVELERPDGSRVKILIPVEGVKSYPNSCIANGRRPFGLNFVTEEHYT